MSDELLDLLACELGEIYLREEQCPGVYYLSVLPTIGRGGEYYVVLTVSASDKMKENAEEKM